MLIIKFATRSGKITWFVDDNWIVLLSFLLTMFTGIAWRRNRIQNINKKLLNPTGGADFID